MNRAKQTIIFAIGAIMICGTGCRTQRMAGKDKVPVVIDPAQGIISILEKEKHDFNTLKLRKVDVKINMNGVRESAKGNIALYRDSLIAVSVIPVLGYEVLRILCTRDSVIVINRLERTYSATSFEYYRRKYKIPVKFEDLQAILANEVFYYKEEMGDRIFEKQLTTRENNNLFIVDAFREGKRLTNQGIVMDNMGQKLENVFITDYESRMKMNLVYDEFTGSEELLFPQKVVIDIIESNNTIQMEMRYGQIEFNDSINIEFAVPVHYTRGDML